MQSLIKSMLIVLSVILITTVTSAQHLRYVQSSDWRPLQNCPFIPCYTLDEYAKQDDSYFTTGSTFVFLAGNHSLPYTLNIKNISNITFRGGGDNTNQYPDIDTLCYYRDTLQFENVTNLNVEGLRFVLRDCTNLNKNPTVMTITNSKNILLSNSTFQGSGDAGNSLLRAIHSKNSTIEIVNCTFKGNTGENGGAIIAEDRSNIVLADNIFTGNQAVYTGGAIYARESFITLNGTLTNVFINNSCSDRGGAVDCIGCHIKMMGNNSFTKNFVNIDSGIGGAIAITNSGHIVTSGTIQLFSYNEAGDGGAIYLSTSGASISAEHMYFTGNRARLKGGALHVTNSTIITGNIRTHNKHFFTNNTALGGGAIYCTLCRMEIKGWTKFANNEVSVFPGILYAYGGAISTLQGNVTLCGTAFFTNNKASIGGAIYFSLSSTAQLSGSIVFKHNAALDGGGIYSESTQLIITQPLQMVFVGNTAQLRGGGVNIRGYVISKWIIISGIFIENKGKKCGGAIFIERENNVTLKNIIATGNSDSAICVSESNITFKGGITIASNTGRYGGGINSRNSILSFTAYTVFENNSALFGDASYSLYGKISFIKDILFAQNTAGTDGGGLYALGTEINLEYILNFTTNSAQNGGAMYFKSAASLTMQTFSRLATSYNYAAEYGGVIYNEDAITPIQCTVEVDVNQTDDEIVELPFCFLRLVKIIPSSVHPVKIYTTINSSYDLAGKDGDFLYGGLLDRCQMITKDVANQPTRIVPYKLLKDDVIGIKVDSHTTKAITSKSYELCFCEDTEIKNCSRMTNIEIHRGQSWTISLLALDQVRTITSTLVTAITGPTARIKLKQSSQLLPQYCSNLTYNLYSAKDYEELILYPDGPCRDIGLARAVIKVTLLPCPIAFIRSNEECICEERLQIYDVNCTISDKIYITKRAGSKLWMSTLFNEGLILYSTCPTDYCRENTVSIYLDNIDNQCDLNRCGILCGKCKTNHSLLLGSSSCKVCNNNYLALLLPISAAGIILVIFLSIIRLTVATGMLNSLILYANIVQTNKNLFLPINTRNVLTVFVAWLNLDLGFDTCFYDGMDAYAQTWLQFIFPIYVWIIISVIILTSRYSITVSKLIGHNPIAVLATLLLMSYTKILKIIIEVYIRL